jgi:hypothetical protein
MLDVQDGVILLGRAPFYPSNIDDRLGIVRMFGQMDVEPVTFQNGKRPFIHWLN